MLSKYQAFLWEVDDVVAGLPEIVEGLVLFALDEDERFRTWRRQPR